MLMSATVKHFGGIPTPVNIFDPGVLYPLLGLTVISVFDIRFVSGFSSSAMFRVCWPRKRRSQFEYTSISCSVDLPIASLEACSHFATDPVVCFWTTAASVVHCLNPDCSSTVQRSTRSDSYCVDWPP